MTDEQMTRVNYYWIRYYCFVVTQLSQGKMMTVGISLKQLFQLCSGKYLKSGPSKFKAVSKVCLCWLCQDSLTEKGGEKYSVRLNWLGWEKRHAKQWNIKGWIWAPYKFPEFVCEFGFFSSLAKFSFVYCTSVTFRQCDKRAVFVLISFQLEEVIWL